MVEYSKNLFTCKVLDGKMKDRRYRVVDGVIYFHDQINLTRDSKLKDKLLYAAYKIFLSTPIDFIRTHHIILNGFMWEGFEEYLYQNYQIFMYHMDME